MPLIAVLDYEIGNLRSAQKALQHLGADAGQHHAGRLADQPGVRGEAGVGPDVLEGLLGRAQVPDLVVEDGDQSRHVR